MMRKPNAVQKALHRFFMWQPVTAFFAPRAHRIDQAMLTLTKGRYAATEILGWNIIQLMTLGAKTCQWRSVPLLAVYDGQKIGLIGSSFGRRHNPAWYYNLKAHPECRVPRHGKIRMFIAREVGGDEYRKYWQLAVSCYEGYEKYRIRAPHRRIPIMVLDPKM